MRTFSRLFSRFFPLAFCLLPAAALAQDVSVKSILQPSATVCGGNVAPVTVVVNTGSTTLTSFRLNYVLDGVLIANYNWDGTLEAGQSDTLTFPFLNLALGVYDLEVYSSDPNFATDIQPANDTLRRTFEVTKATGIDPPLRADFDDNAFPSTGYIVNNPDGKIGWARTELATVSGEGALFMNNFNYRDIGQEDEITLPGVNLRKLDKAALSFYLAYAPYGVNSGFADTLEVYVSGDCGQTFDRVYRRFGSELATAAPTTSEFVPRGSWEWRKEWIDLSPYENAAFLVVRFRHVNNYENNLYLDRIRVEEIFALGIEEDLQDLMGWQVQVDRASASFMVTFGEIVPAGTQLRLLDIQGRVVRSAALPPAREVIMPAGELAPGMYLLQLEGVAAKPLRVIWE